MSLTEQAAERLVREMDGAAEPEPTLVPRTVDLAIEYTDPQGELHVETFPLTVLGPKGRLEAERFSAAMAAPAPWDSLPTATQNRFLAFAHAVWALGLDEQLKKRKPHWLTAALEEDDDLLALVDAEVRAHRGRYFRGDRRQGGAGAQLRRLVVAPLVARGALGEPAVGPHDG